MSFLAPVVFDVNIIAEIVDGDVGSAAVIAAAKLIRNG